MLDEVLARISGYTPEQKIELYKIISQHSAGNDPWKLDSRNQPQIDAYFCKADVLLYGGQAGGGKTDLLLGLGFTAHERSLIMRRKYTDLNAIIDRAIEINGSKDGLNRSPPPKFRTINGKMIDFGACVHLGDEQGWQGNPHDYLGFDEVVQFLESQVRFLMGWVRTT